MKRIAYICADAGVPVFGSKGASVHVQEVLRALLRQGNQVELFATRAQGQAPHDLAAVPLHVLPAPPAGSAQERARDALQANAATRDALAGVARLRGPFDAVYERYSLWSHAGMGYARDAGCVGVLEVNAPLIEEQALHRELALPEQAVGVARRVFAEAHALIAVSPGVADYLAGFDSERSRIHVVANGVDPARFTAAADTRRSGQDRPFTVGFLGTLKPWHGLAGLVEAFRMLREQQRVDARLMLIGDGPRRASLESTLEAAGLREQTLFTGALAPHEVAEALARVDVGVAPYPGRTDFYFSPLKIFEYMAAGLPVVATDVGHLSELVVDGFTGMLVPPDDPAALAAALACLARDAGPRHDMGYAARLQALRWHSWDAVATRILDIVRQVAPHAQARMAVSL